MEEVDKEISEMKLFVRLPTRLILASGGARADIGIAERESSIRGRVILDTGRCFAPLAESASC